MLDCHLAIYLIISPPSSVFTWLWCWSHLAADRFCNHGRFAVLHGGGGCGGLFERHSIIIESIAAWIVLVATNWIRSSAIDYSWYRRGAMKCVSRYNRTSKSSQEYIVKCGNEFTNCNKLKYEVKVLINMWEYSTGKNICSPESAQNLLEIFN